jgi:uncharacterized protein (DUF305 family)
MRTSIIGVGAAAAVAAALIAGCGGGHDTMPGMQHGPASNAPAEQGGHNQADVAFVQQMVPHHSQAVEMAKLVPSHSASQQVKDLAARIEGAQQPEIAQMTGWLARWGIPSAAPSSAMPDMHHGSMGTMPDGSEMPGMMSADAMQQLVQAHGADFDRMWLQMMIKHHQGAIDMARTELAQGESQDAKSLAQRIIDAQQAEIDLMRGMPESR